MAWRKRSWRDREKLESAASAEGLGTQKAGGDNGKRPGGLQGDGGADHPSDGNSQQQLAATITADQLLQLIQLGCGGGVRGGYRTGV